MMSQTRFLPPYALRLSPSDPKQHPIITVELGFEYVTYNDAEELKRVVKRINRRGKIRSLFGRARRGVAAIMMEPLQVRQE